VCSSDLTNNYTILNDSSIIYLDYYDWPGYKMTSPWRSAMNQGRAMQAFVRAFEKTNDRAYLEYARKAMNVLYTEVKDGGVTYKDSTGYWFEEYADDGVPQSRVLNGMIVTLQGLSDYYKVTKEAGALFLFNQGVKAVKNSLYLYDNNGHSNYDILGKPAKPWYHEFHIGLLDFLYNETHDHIFNDYKQKWMRYKEPSYLTELIHKPTRIGVFVVLSQFIAILALVCGINCLAVKVKKEKSAGKV
jgi:rhamnogalacturonyl hydrolase YesR